MIAIMIVVLWKLQKMKRKTLTDAKDGKDVSNHDEAVNDGMTLDHVT